MIMKLKGEEEKIDLQVLSKKYFEAWKSIINQKERLKANKL